LLARCWLAGRARVVERQPDRPRLGPLRSDLRPRHLDKIVTQTVAFDDLPGVFDDFVAGRNTGRTVVTIAGDDQG